MWSLVYTKYSEIAVKATQFTIKTNFIIQKMWIMQLIACGKKKGAGWY